MRSEIASGRLTGPSTPSACCPGGTGFSVRPGGTFSSQRTGSNCRPKADSPNDYLADLNHRRKIGVLGDVSQDLLRVRPEAGLERFHRFTENVAHRDIRRRSTRGATRQPLVDGVVPTVVGHARLHQRHVLIAVVIVVESSPRLMRVHHAHFDHVPPPGAILSACREPDRAPSAPAGAKASALMLITFKFIAILT